MKILIVGGYGTFGGRLVDLLATTKGLDLVIAGRDFGKATAFIAARKSPANLRALKFDREAPQAILQSEKPDLVVDASGPFQTYGERPYRLVEACIAARCNYLDLADGLDFVNGISKYDSDAKAANVFALSGMSSFPVLTAATIRHLAQGMGGIAHAESGVAPSPFAGVGLNVIKSITSYAGKPVKLLHNGAWTSRSGLWDSRTMVINVPGEIPMPPIRFALTEVPDLKVVVGDWPGVRSVWTGAGPTPALLHRFLWAAAGLVKLGVLRSLLPFAPMINSFVNQVRWGEHRGGMIVAVQGHNGEKRSWHLVAEGNAGPFIPATAAEGIVRNCLVRKKPPAGARSGHQDLEFTDFAQSLSRLNIRHGIRTGDEGATLYQRLLGEAFERLHKRLQDFHSHKASYVLHGSTEVSNGANLVATLVRKFFKFPTLGQDIPIDVNVAITPHEEIWTRSFAGQHFVSKQSVGKNRYEGLMLERFGSFSFGLAITESHGRLSATVRRGDFLGLPIPKCALPKVKAVEFEENAKFNFDVEISLPIVGRIVRYHGWLESDMRQRKVSTRQQAA